MYKNTLEVYKEVRDRFAYTDSLSKGESFDCYYGKHVNGIGCAIGCLVDEGAFDHFELLGIREIYREYRSAYNKYFSDELFWDLDHLQHLHDSSGDYKEFMEALGKEIAIIEARQTQ